MSEWDLKSICQGHIEQAQQDYSTSEKMCDKIAKLSSNFWSPVAFQPRFALIQGLQNSGIDFLISDPTD